MKILFKNANILDLSCETGFVFGDVVVEDEKIIFVGQKYDKKCDKEIDVKSNILMPGFVNAHCHSPMTLLRGVKDDVDLQDWLYNYIIPLEEKFTEKDLEVGEVLAICEYLRGGITTFEENYFNPKVLVNTIKKCQIKARVGIGFISANKDDENELENQYKLFKNVDSNMIKPVCYAHSIYGTTEEQREILNTFAKNNNLPVSLHLSETLKEVGDCTVKNELTPPQYLEQLGLLDRKCTAYHCVHMDKDDLDILSDYAVNVVTCPSSNIKLASGIAPIYAMQNKNINIAIGTDGASSNDGLDMFKEMFLVSTLSKVNIYNSEAVKVKEVIAMATKNGAKALGFENVGEIKVGNFADIILIDTQKPHWQPKNNLISHLVYSAKSSDVYMTMVNGKILYQNGKLNIPYDEKQIIEQANNIYERITK